MPQCNIRFGSLRRAAFVSAIWLFQTATLWAASDIVNPEPGYLANDRFTSIALQSHDVGGDLMAVYSFADGLTLYDRASGQKLYDLGKSPGASDVWNSFVSFGPGGDSIWVGYDYNIYKVTDIFGAPAWEHRASVFYNFDLAFQGETPYVVGFGDASANTIWRLDPGGPVAVASVGGFSAGIAFDTDGNLYYATNLSTGNKLVRFSMEQLEAGNLTLDDAETLADLPFPAYDTEVDEAGHVLFDFNDGQYTPEGTWIQRSSSLAVWNGVSGPGENYDLIGTAGGGHWFSFISFLGSAVDGEGAIFINDGAFDPPHPGLAEIRHVPEPAAVVLILGGALAWLLWRRRKT